MLFETLKHSYIFLGSIYFGLICGIFKIILNTLLTIKKNKILITIFDLLFMIVFTSLFIVCLNLVNYGEFRFYLLIGYILGFIFVKKSIMFLVDFLVKKIYTGVSNLTKKIKIKKGKNSFDTKSSEKIN